MNLEEARNSGIEERRAAYEGPARSPLKQRLVSVPPVAWLMVLTLGCLLPFVHKAFFIDDTLFLRAAQQIQKHPADFYGFTMNWFGTPKPMILDFDNPPLTCYYIALVASVVGWSEIALHLAFLVPALAAAWGTFALAQRYCQRPMLAAVVAVLTPVFVISATTVMCDVTLLALWVWAIVLFERGLDKNAWTAFLGSGLLAGLAVLTKLTGLALVPLLAAYGLVQRRRPGWWMLALIVPVLSAATYEWITSRLYGHGMLFTASTYAAVDRTHTEGDLSSKAMIGLVFAGGCFLPTLFYLPWLWPRRFILAGACALVPIAFLVPHLDRFNIMLLGTGEMDWNRFLQAALFVAGGIHLFLLAGADFWRRRDPCSFLLAVWIMGIFVFAFRLNWTINGRSFLPMTPAVGILLARCLDSAAPLSRSGPSWRLLWPSLPAAALCLLLARADCREADSCRRAASYLAAHYHKPGHTLWFEGHWGFQYYMEQLGAKALDITVTKLDPGDIVVIPENLSNTRDLPKASFRLIDTLEYRPDPHVATVNYFVWAGFYASTLGPLPYVFADVASDYFDVYESK